jgi:hypothetical protein
MWMNLRLFRIQNSEKMDVSKRNLWLLVAMLVLLVTVPSGSAEVELPSCYPCPPRKLRVNVRTNAIR